MKRGEEDILMQNYSFLLKPYQISRNIGIKKVLTIVNTATGCGCVIIFVAKLRKSGLPFIPI